MKNHKMFILIGAILFVGIMAYVSGSIFLDSSSEDVSASSMSKGLIAYWPLDGENYNSATSRVTDKTPYLNHGTNSGASLDTGRDGESNGSMTFDGSSDYVKTDEVVVSSPSELTISGWIKKESGGSNYECALHQGAGSSVGASAFWFGVSSTDYLTATIGAGTGVGWAAGQTSTLAVYGQWYYLAAVWDGSVVRVYIDGEYNKQYNLASYNSLTTPTRIGASSDGANYQFSGGISDVRIYDRALSASEVQELYGSTERKFTTGSLNKGLILDMPLKSSYTKTETAGSEVMTDRTPYSNDGTNVGATVGSDYSSFDGNTDGINLLNNNFTDLSDFTFSTWINIDGTHKHYDGAMISSGNWNTEHWSFSIEQNNDGVNSRRPSFYASYNFNLNEWYNVVFTRVGSTLKYYVNGVEIATTESSSYIPLGSGASNTMIGRETYAGGFFAFNGDISDVRIYDRALSATEVESLYGRGRN